MLKKIISRRGNVRTLYSDNGTNFVGAERELRDAFKSMDHSKIQSFLKEHSEADWMHIEWKRNPPYASHFGGVWGRQIRTVRSVLNSILHHNSKQLTDESLRTFLCEVECIVNSRPLTLDTLSDPNSLKTLSPNMLLTMKSKVVFPRRVYLIILVT